jgi:hypothetical protein
MSTNLRRPDPDADRSENEDLIRPGSDGPQRRHQTAITGSQIAQPSDEMGGCGATWRLSRCSA